MSDVNVIFWGYLAGLVLLALGSALIIGAAYLADIEDAVEKEKGQ